ncbi:MAG: hypothetical protein Ct9H300mP12_17440 [Acidimicrobiales bacterium]|nr:MAG: hypothetical protein Ct9H300mP12_17440 [Acidimicrobiales bacterium]
MHTADLSFTAVDDGSLYEFNLERIFTFRMKGIGYHHPEWGHGAWKGDLAMASERWDLSESTTRRSRTSTATPGAGHSGRPGGDRRARATVHRAVQTLWIRRVRRPFRLSQPAGVSPQRQHMRATRY